MKALYCHVPSCSGIQDAMEMSCTALCREEYGKSRNGTWQYVLKHASICQYILIWTSTYSIYQLHTTWYHHVLLWYQNAKYRRFAVQAIQGTPLASCIPEQDSARQYKAVWRPCTAMYCLVQVYRMQGKCLVLPCTEKSTIKSLEIVHGSMY